MKGDLSALAMGVIIAMVMMFMGVYMIFIVSDIPGEGAYKDYAYTTTTNATDTGWINSTLNGTHKLTIGAIVSIEGETPDKTLTVIANNSDTSNKTITVYLNDVSIGTVLAIASTADTTKTFTEVNWVANTVNNLTFTATSNSGNDLNVESSAAKYPSSKPDNSFGAIITDLVTSTATVYNVLILVIVITALGVAIAVLRGFGQGGTSGV
jgi:hypothetical protein